MNKTDEGNTPNWTLEEEDIKEVTHPNRRAALVAVGAAVLGGLGAVFLRPNEAEACRRRTGRTDSDPQDGGGHGHTGVSDSDSGDEPGCGGRRRRAPCTDSDSGPDADGPGRGRHCGDDGDR